MNTSTPLFPSASSTHRGCQYGSPFSPIGGEGWKIFLIPVQLRKIFASLSSKFPPSLSAFPFLSPTLSLLLTFYCLRLSPPLCSLFYIPPFLFSLSLPPPYPHKRAIRVNEEMDTLGLRGDIRGKWRQSEREKEMESRKVLQRDSRYTNSLSEAPESCRNAACTTLHVSVVRELQWYCKQLFSVVLFCLNVFLIKYGIE